MSRIPPDFWMQEPRIQPRLPTWLTPTQRAWLLLRWERAPAGKGPIVLMRDLRQLREYGRPYDAQDIDRLMERVKQSEE